jgi:maltose O-acetyltransferase
VLKKIKQYFFFVLYYFIARKFPIGYYPLGGLGRRFRFFCCKRLFKKCGRNVNIERGVDFCDGRAIQIGDNSGLGIDSWIRGNVIIGDNVMMGPQVMIYARYHKFDRTDIPMNQQGMEESGTVIIEDDVWIGARVTILKDVTIGKGSIIGAASVVTKDIPRYSVAVGNPAKVIRTRFVS